MRGTMTLAEYIDGYTDGRSNFFRYDVILENGGVVTAHHMRDKSTEHHYKGMCSGQYLISYMMPDKSHVRLAVRHGDEIVTVYQESKS